MTDVSKIPIQEPFELSSSEFVIVLMKLAFLCTALGASSLWITAATAVGDYQPIEGKLGKLVTNQPSPPLTASTLKQKQARRIIGRAVSKWAARRKQKRSKPELPDHAVPAVSGPKDNAKGSFCKNFRKCATEASWDGTGRSLAT